MDSTEAQLRFGSALSNTTDTTSPSHPLHVNNSRSRERMTREEPRILQVVDTRRRARFGTVGKYNVNFCPDEYKLVKISKAPYQFFPIGYSC